MHGMFLAFQCVFLLLCLTVASEQDGPPPIPSGNQGETASTEGPHSTSTTVQGNSDGAIYSVDPVNNRYTSLVTEETPDPIDVIIHDEPREVDMDLLSRIRGLYRLLDLISEQGSGGTGTMIAPSMPQGY